MWIIIVIPARCYTKNVVVGYPTPSEGWGHGGGPWSPEARQLSRVWTRGPRETESRQRVRSWTVQNEIRGVLGRVPAGQQEGFSILPILER